MKSLRLFLFLGLAVLPWLTVNAAQQKQQSVTITAQMRATVQANVANYPWAKKQRDAAVKGAKRWLEMSDAQLWQFVTPQSLPRTIHTTLIRGTNRVAICPKCREGIEPFGNYPWRIDALKRPWKLECPNCKEVFPKNDFWAYYLSALDEHGKFQPGKGDRRLLVNAEHPDPNDPLHKWGVDDGYGWYDETGLRWAFVAYYNSWGQWRMVCDALDALVQAYVLTDDTRYAHKAGVLLDRIADVYPEMDTFDYITKLKFEHSDGSSGFGRIEGAIWETGVATHFALAYDRVFDGMAADPSLVAFLSSQAQKYKLGPKDSFAAIQKNIEDNLLLEIVKGVKDCRISGNEGMHQVSIAAAAIALDRQPLTNELLDWIFSPGARSRNKKTGRGVNSGGNVPFIINGTMDRDGMGSEGAPGYSSWGTTMFTLADLLERYPAYTRHNMFRDFPKYKQSFLTPVRWACLGQATPPIGDSGACGAWGTVCPSLQQLFTVYGVYRDPLLAQKIFELCGKHVERLPNDIYAADPTAVKEEIARVAGKDPLPLKSANLNGFGLAIMQTPSAQNGRALWMYYGRNSGHGHRDRLNIGLYAKNIDMLPDLGYPEYASGRPKDIIWERNAIAHNTVIVDDLPQQTSYTGHLLLFDGQGKALVIEAESPGLYTGVTTYRRLTAMIEAGEGDSYLVDLVRVCGGQTHRQSWHGPASEAQSTGLKLVAQSKGTFAGEDVPLGQLPDNWRGNPGYMYLYDVARDRNPPDSFALDYVAEDRRKRIDAAIEPHLRLTCLTPCQEVALAHGDPPQNKRGNPRRLRYAVLTRSGKSLQSLFTTIVEPYDARPLIASVRRLPIRRGPDDPLTAAIEVTLADGRVDTILCCREPARVEVDGPIVLEGTFGIVARRDGKVQFAKLVAGTSLRAPGLDLTCPATSICGQVVSIDTSRPDDNRVTVTFDRPADPSLAGRVAVFENDKQQDATYTIRRIERRQDTWELSTGDSTLVRGYADPKNFAGDVVCNVRPGDRLRIPLSAQYDSESPAAGPRP
jgi:hypothetical protein